MKDVYFGIDMAATGKRIDSLFRKYNITTRQMSDALHVTYQCVDKWRKGRCLPETHNLFILARLFDMDIDEIVIGEFNQKELDSDSSTDINKIDINSIKSKNLADIITKINKVKKYNALRTDVAKSITLIDRVFFVNMQINKESLCYNNSFLSILYNRAFDNQELYFDIDNSIVDSPKDKRYAMYLRAVMLRRQLLFVPELDCL